MSAQPPTTEPASPSPAPVGGPISCPRCSAEIGPEQDWCLECGAPARTRLAPTPNWQLPTGAIAAIVLIAGALLAFAFVRLTSDDGSTTPSTQAPVVATQPAPTPPAATPGTTTPPLTAPAPATPAPSTTTPGTTAPSDQAPTAAGQGTTPAGASGANGTTSTAPAPSTPSSKQKAKKKKPKQKQRR